MADLTQSLQRIVQQVATRPEGSADVEQRNRRVKAALFTLATHDATREAWSLVLEDLIATNVLRTIVPGEQFGGELALLQEGKRQVVLQLLLAVRQALGEGGA